MMNFKNLFKTIAITAMALTLVLALAGCGDTKALLEYSKQVSDIGTANQAASTEFMTALGTIDPANETSKQTLVDSISKMEEQYKKLVELKAPKKMEEVQKTFKSASEKALEGLGIYKTTFQGMSADTATEDLLTPLQEGDAIMVEAQKLFQEGVDKVNEIAK